MGTGLLQLEQPRQEFCRRVVSIVAFVRDCWFCAELSPCAGVIAARVVFRAGAEPDQLAPDPVLRDCGGSHRRAELARVLLPLARQNSAAGTWAGGSSPSPRRGGRGIDAG